MGGGHLDSGPNSHGGQERRGKSWESHPPTLLAGTLLTPMPPQGSTAYIF